MVIAPGITLPPYLTPQSYPNRPPIQPKRALLARIVLARRSFSEAQGIALFQRAILRRVSAPFGGRMLAEIALPGSACIAPGYVG